MSKRIHEILRLAIIIFFVFTFSRSAEAVSFYNSTPISIPGSGTSGMAYDYPSMINVSGLTGIIVDVDVTLYGLSHTFPADLDVLLVGPLGQSVILLSDVGASHDITNVTLTFDDSAASPVPHPFIISGTYQTHNIGSSDSFPAPAPLGPYGSLLSVFNGTDPNGYWSLYVFDDAATDIGSIAGWSLDIETYTGDDGSTPVPEPTSFILLGVGLISLTSWARRKLR